MIRSQEVELKLELAARDVDPFRRLPFLDGPAEPAAELETIYFDTPEGTLRNAGFSLRVRRSPAGYVQTVKYRAADSGGFSDRDEWEKPVAGLEPDLEAAAETPLRKLLGKKKVRERLTRVSETRVRRTAWMLPSGAGEIELILDEGEVISGERRQPISEIELELKRGGKADLFGLAKEIGDAIQLRMGVMSKSERGFMLLEKRKTRVKKAERVMLEPGMNVAEAFAAIVQACLRHFRLNEPLAMERNAAALHQARVAMRRLRSAFSLFRPAIAEEEFGRLRDELRWFTAQLGDARNLDVLLARAREEEVSEADAASLRRKLRKARTTAYEKVVSALSSRRLTTLILDLVAWAETGGWRGSETALAPIPAFAGERLERRWRRVRKAGKRLTTLEPEFRHQLRIDIKKLRYATEFFAALTPRKARGGQQAFLAILESLQDSLGQLNDIETAKMLAPGIPVEEGKIETLLEEAQRAHDRLREQGPYWRFPVNSGKGGSPPRGS